MAAAIVQFAGLARRRLVGFQETSGGLVQCLRQHQRTCVVVRATQMFQRRGQCQEFAQRIPAQVVLVDELLHVLGRRTAGAGLEQAAARHQRHDRQHLGAGAQLHDREQVGEVVAQHVAGHRDGVLALADALEREARRFQRAPGCGCRAPRCRGPSDSARPWRSPARRARGSCPARTRPAYWRCAHARRPASPSRRSPRPWSGTCARCRRPRPRVRISPCRPDRRHARCRRPESGRSCRASRIPRPSVAIRPTLGTLPMVDGSNAPLALQSSIIAW